MYILVKFASSGRTREKPESIGQVIPTLSRLCTHLGVTAANAGIVVGATDIAAIPMTVGMSIGSDLEECMAERYKVLALERVYSSRVSGFRREFLLATSHPPDDWQCIVIHEYRLSYIRVLFMYQFCLLAHA
jgi:hypothetical protein